MMPTRRKGGSNLAGYSWGMAARLTHCAAGATLRSPQGLRQGTSGSPARLDGSRGMSCHYATGAPSGAKCHIVASTAHVERGQARGGAYTSKVHCGRARGTQDACSVPRTMLGGRTSTMASAVRTRPPTAAPWQSLMCTATRLCPV